MSMTMELGQCKHCSWHVPFSAMEPRTATRWEIHKFAREAYDVGIRFIGGCCGFEAYHIRAIAEEVTRP